MTIKDKILESLQDSVSNDQGKLVFYFSGSLSQIVLLKTLLKETKRELLVYFFDKTKYALDDLDFKAEQARNGEILEKYKKWYRSFEAKEIDLPSSEIKTAADFEDLFFHAKILKKIHQEVGGFDAYLITQDSSFFENQLKVLELYNHLKKTELKVEFLSPFSTFKAQEISSEALSTPQALLDSNSFRIYRENKNLIEALKSFDEKKAGEEQKIISLINSKTDLAAIYFYLLWNDWAARDIFLDKLGHLVSKEMHVASLTSNAIAFAPRNEKAITLSVALVDISDQELNQILLNKLSNFAGKENLATQKKVDEIDYFLRLYDHKINEETRDQLLQTAFNFGGFRFLPLLEKLISFKCDDVGELLLRIIDDFRRDLIDSQVAILLEILPSEKIHQLQLNEALLKAFQKKLYPLCHRLIKAGAEKKVLQFHAASHGFRLWLETRAPDIKHVRQYWRQKDRVIIAEILKELGNPQEKVPPVIHVTGSNGKGSTCAFLKSILQKNGYRSHVFTSPCIIRNNENYIISGEEILDEDNYRCLQKVEEAFNKIKNTAEFQQKIDAANKLDGLTEKQIAEDDYLGWSFHIPAMILAFAEKPADATIVEVITGGEFDLSNVFNQQTTIATIINSIIFGDSHAGNTHFENIEAVAKTKSRLAKEGVPMFSAAQEDLVAREIKKTADEKNCPLFVFGKDFAVQNFDENHFIYQGFGKEFKLQKPRLVGGVQINNAAIALSALLKTGRFNLAEEKVSEGIKEAYQIGRFSEIEPVVEGYERVYFGSAKFRALAFESNSLDCKKVDAILTLTGDSNEFIGGSNSVINRYNRVLFVGRNRKNIELSQKLVGTNLVDKAHLSSAVASFSKDKSNTSKILEIKSTGISSFPKNYLQLFGQIRQPNFQKDLAFAEKHSLLTKEEIELMK